MLLWPGKVFPAEDRCEPAFGLGHRRWSIAVPSVCRYHEKIFSAPLAIICYLAPRGPPAWAHLASTRGKKQCLDPKVTAVFIRFTVLVANLDWNLFHQPVGATLRGLGAAMYGPGTTAFAGGQTQHQQQYLCYMAVDLF